MAPVGMSLLAQTHLDYLAIKSSAGDAKRKTID